MFLALLSLPLCSFLIACYGSTFVGRNGILLYTVLNMSVVNIFSLFLLFILLLNNYSLFMNFNCWLGFLELDSTWLFRLDFLSVSMCYIVSLISLFVHIYSVDYMYGDHNRSLFLGYLSLFTFFMLLLVCSGTTFLFFLSWEGVGICSYLLINFWNTRIIATQSAIKALFVNKISDLFLFTGLLILSLLHGSTDIGVIEICSPLLSVESISVLGYTYTTQYLCCVLLFIGVIGKSSQLFLHIWLPDAMEGPTPVSALLHAATMVTAGIFLILRFSFIFDENVNVLQYAGILGGVTIVVSGTIGLFQFDIKKVIAYSTCSQLGYMLVACSASVYYISLYHFTIHAFFKALLFLLAGCLIHSLMNEQDMRKYGGFIYSFPLCFILFIVASSSLVAEPFLSGYYSKELIIFSLNGVYLGSYSFIYWLSLYGAILTVLYSARSVWLIFFSKFRGFINMGRGLHDLTYILIYPLVILGILSLVGGYVYSGIYRDGSVLNVFSSTEHHELSNHYIYDFISMEHNYIVLLCNCTLGGILLLYYLSKTYVYSIYFNTVNCFIINKWYFDTIYNRIGSFSSFFISEHILYQILDKGYIEYIGPLGLYETVSYYARVSFVKNDTILTDVLYVFVYVATSVVVILYSYLMFSYNVIL